jgi:hypothetical protein
MTEPKQLPPEFYDMVDQFLGLADAMHQAWPRSRVSHTLMYAAARYGADYWLERHGDTHDSDDALAEHAAGQYREMFIDNLLDLRQRYLEEGGFDITGD